NFKLIDDLQLPHIESINDMLASLDIHFLTTETPLTDQTLAWQLLYQTGYLTIKSVLINKAIGPNDLVLNYPNREVSASLAQHIVIAESIFTSSSITGFSRYLRDAALAGDVDGMAQVVREALATVPNIVLNKDEHYFHVLVHFMLQAAGFQTFLEVAVSGGRIDLYFEVPSIVYVIEFKQGLPAKAALQQILDQRYHERWLSSGKPIYLVGLAFTKKSKKPVAVACEWQMVERTAPRKLMGKPTGKPVVKVAGKPVVKKRVVKPLATKVSLRDTSDASVIGKGKFVKKTSKKK
ncbi:MAG: PD-(D/E)XK nuclease domain-containing protein, partial [Nanoarchaeota archaeon]